MNCLIDTIIIRHNDINSKKIARNSAKFHEIRQGISDTPTPRFFNEPLPLYIHWVEHK